LVLPFWYRLTQVVLEKRPLNGCSNYNVYTEGTGTGKQTNAAKPLPSGVTSLLVDIESGLCRQINYQSKGAQRAHTSTRTESSSCISEKYKYTKENSALK